MWVSSLALSLLALADLGLVTSLDGLDSTLGMTFVAGEEMKPVVFGKSCLETLAGCTGNVFLDVMTNNYLKMFLNITTTNNKTFVGINRTGGTKFRKNK